jgi:hypothetical protein
MEKPPSIRSLLSKTVLRNRNGFARLAYPKRWTVRRAGDQPADGAAHPALRGNSKAHDPAGKMDPDAINRILRKYAAGIGLSCGYPAHFDAGDKLPPFRPAPGTCSPGDPCVRPCPYD